MAVEIRTEPFEPWSLMAAYSREHPELDGPCGASDCFVGWMRDHNEGDRVDSMVLEHYPGMTERELQRLLDEASARHGLLDALIVHRVGEIHLGEAIVLVATFAAHRREAFAACREIMEALKSTAPFWKKERLGADERWVERNTPGF